MSLLQSLPYSEYKKALSLSVDQCEKIARFAHLRIQFGNTNIPGELLMKELDRTGCTTRKYAQLLSHVETILTYYKPQAKVAILIANEKYINLSKLATPSVDCDSLGEKLRDLGFIVVTIKNTTSCVLKEILKRLCDYIPDDSYAFIFYAGHGCQICNTMCLLGVDTPTENIQFEHCVTENFILRELQRCRLDSVIMTMDMCRVFLDRSINPQIYESMSYVEDYKVYRNLLITYSCQTDQAAYEVLQIECSTTIDNCVTYELKTGDLDRIVPRASQYVNALCSRIGEDLDLSSLLDKVHEDIENSMKKQRPMKVQCGVEKRSLYDPVTGDSEALRAKLQEVSTNFSECCIVSQKKEECYA